MGQVVRYAPPPEAAKPKAEAKAKAKLPSAWAKSGDIFTRVPVLFGGGGGGGLNGNQQEHYFSLFVLAFFLSCLLACARLLLFLGGLGVPNKSTPICVSISWEQPFCLVSRTPTKSILGVPLTQTIVLFFRV